MSRFGSLDGLPDGAGTREALFSVRYVMRNASVRAVRRPVVFSAWPS